MPNIIRKIVGEQIQTYVKSSKFCKINARSCVIGGKFGMLSVDLSGFFSASSCQLKLRRNSGNGLIAVVKNNKSENYNISSKVSEVINVDISDSKQLSIIRPASGIGDVELLGIFLLSDEVAVPLDIRAEVVKCGTKGIRSVGDRFFANEGSMIKSNEIAEIETEPPGMFKKATGGMIFTGMCEIVNLKIGTPVIEQPPDFVQAVQKASELIPEQSKARSLGHETALERALSFDHKPSQDVFDSDNNISVCAVGTKLTIQDRILMKDVPLKPNSKYVLLVQGKRIDGNGRITINIYGSNLRNHSIFVGPNETTKIPFTTLEADSFKIDIDRGGPSLGDVWISRVSIAPYSVLYGYENDFTGIRAEKSSDVELTSKRFALLKRERFNPPETFSDIDGIIEAKGPGPNSWLNKIQPLFPNVKVRSDMILTPEPKGAANMLITQLGDVKKANKIWLNEFQGIVPNKDELKILKETKVISSSLPNVQYLRNTHGIDALYLPKVWPYVEPIAPSVKKYILMFNRDTRITKAFIEEYKGRDLPTLVVPGLRGNIPQFVKATSEYLDYRTLLGLVLNASAIVDFPQCTHFMSAVLDMAFIAGVPIVTTNQWMSVSKPSTYQVPSLLNRGMTCPKMDVAIRSVQAALNDTDRNKFDESYNHNVYASIKTALDY